MLSREFLGTLGNNLGLDYGILGSHLFIYMLSQTVIMLVITMTEDQPLEGVNILEVD